MDDAFTVLTVTRRGKVERVSLFRGHLTTEAVVAKSVVETGPIATKGSADIEVRHMRVSELS